LVLERLALVLDKKVLINILQNQKGIGDKVDKLFMKKRLYWNSCSFLDTESILHNTELNKLFTNVQNEPFETLSHQGSVSGSSNKMIFRRTLIDCSKNNFDFVLIAWSHPQRNVVSDITEELDYKKLKAESDNSFFPNRLNQLHGYNENPMSNSFYTNNSKFEPMGTDDTILYSIALHNFFQNKSIPHLFLNMGILDSKVLSARENWLKYIDPKNYLSLNNDDTILEKMQFSFTKYYIEKAGLNILNDKEMSDLLEKNNNNLRKTEYFKNSWVYDSPGHLGNLAIMDISSKIYEHILKNKLL
jgi:hypothetical protein